MCWKYKNPHGTVFVKCDVYNTQPWTPSYLHIFTDRHEGYYETTIIVLIVVKS